MHVVVYNKVLKTHFKYLQKTANLNKLCYKVINYTQTKPVLQR